MAYMIINASVKREYGWHGWERRRKLVIQKLK
ncbi:uncharacterized protein G2W53_026997 [Senna tora]|uniref:Uncharacterized protein n=1 Tax=Senna tora TaxID=362788 RepID=A0A834WG64_9FABA|nr:uncharacterized protein G2W53_026997 [Senna tora]